jgi:hypothetical protein
LAAIARIGEIIGAFLGGEVCERLRDGFDERGKRSCGALAKCCFELSECLFDWIEVGAIGREIAQRRAGPLDRFFEPATV